MLVSFFNSCFRKISRDYSLSLFIDLSRGNRNFGRGFDREFDYFEMLNCHHYVLRYLIYPPMCSNILPILLYDPITAKIKPDTARVSRPLLVTGKSSRRKNPSRNSVWKIPRRLAVDAICERRRAPYNPGIRRARKTAVGSNET